MRKVTWYFDFVSPFAYIGLHRLKELPGDVSIEFKPVLFAGLLNPFYGGPVALPNANAALITDSISNLQRVEQLAHARFDAVRQLARNDDQRLLADCHGFDP